MTVPARITPELQATIERFRARAPMDGSPEAKYGTSPGAIAAWDVRGRGRHPKPTSPRVRTMPVQETLPGIAPEEQDPAGTEAAQLDALRELARIGDEDKKLFQRESVIKDFRHENPAYGAYVTILERRLDEEFAAGRDSTTLNTDDNNDWLPERIAEQQDLMDGFIKGALTGMDGQPLNITPWDKVPDSKEGLILAGLGASGKTTLLQGLNDPAGMPFVKTTGMEGAPPLSVDLSKVVVINHDDIKEAMIASGMCERYRGLTPGESAPLLHDESVYIAKKLAELAISQGKAVVFDWGAPAARSDMAEQINAMHAGGYTVRGVLVDASVERSVAGAAIRHLGPDSHIAVDRQSRTTFQQPTKRYVQFQSMEGQRYRGRGTNPKGQRLKSETAATFKQNQGLFDQSWWFDRGDTSMTYDLIHSTDKTHK